MYKRKERAREIALPLRIRVKELWQEGGGKPVNGLTATVNGEKTGFSCWRRKSSRAYFKLQNCGRNKVGETEEERIRFSIFTSCRSWIKNCIPNYLRKSGDADVLVGREFMKNVLKLEWRKTHSGPRQQKKSFS